MAAKYLYICNEEGCEGEYTEKSMKELYDNTVDKETYSTYEGWKWDMLRSGTFHKL